jgi:2-hydroxycyclohexanecarboxyl-CoA dehydrogenase
LHQTRTLLSFRFHGRGTERRGAIVTGCASGIGLGIAERLARDGARAGVFDLNGAEADAAAAKIRADGGVASTGQVIGVNGGRTT